MENRSLEMKIDRGYGDCFERRDGDEVVFLCSFSHDEKLKYKQHAATSGHHTFL